MKNLDLLKELIKDFAFEGLYFQRDNLSFTGLYLHIDEAYYVLIENQSANSLFFILRIDSKTIEYHPPYEIKHKFPVKIQPKIQ